MELVTRKTHKARNYYHIVAEDDGYISPGPDGLISPGPGDQINDSHHMHHPLPHIDPDKIYPADGTEINTPYLDEATETMMNLEFAYLGLLLVMIGIAIAGHSGLVNLNLTGRLYNFKSLGFVTIIIILAMLMPAMCCFKAKELYSREFDHRYEDDQEWKSPGNEAYFNEYYDFQIEDGHYDSMLNWMKGLLVFPVLCICCPIFMISCDKLIANTFNKMCGGLMGGIAKDQIAPSKEKSMGTKGLEMATNPDGVIKAIGGIGKELGKAMDTMFDPYNNNNTAADKKSNPVYNRPTNAFQPTDNYEASEDDSDTPLIDYVEQPPKQQKTNSIQNKKTEEENKKSSEENNITKEMKDEKKDEKKDDNK